MYASQLPTRPPPTPDRAPPRLPPPPVPSFTHPPSAMSTRARASPAPASASEDAQTRDRRSGTPPSTPARARATKLPRDVAAPASPSALEPATPARDGRYDGPWSSTPCESLRDARRALESASRALSEREAEELARARDGGGLARASDERSGKSAKTVSAVAIGGASARVDEIAGGASRSTRSRG